MSNHITSPLLKPNSDALDDPTLGSAGLVAKDIAIDATIDKDPTQQTYGSINEDLESSSSSNANGSTTVQDETNDSELSPTKLKIVIASLYVGGFLAALDTTVVTTLLSTIASEINAVSKMSWIATSYLLSCSAFQPLYGKLSDIFGRKPLLLFSNITFAIGCLLCGISHSLVGLALGRFIAGIGGGGLTSLGTITTSDLVPLRKRGVYQGFANISFGLGASFGGLFGAFFDKTLGWEYAFYSQVPIALLSGFLIWRNLELPKGSIGLGIKGSKGDKLKQVDFLGASLLVSSLLAFMVLVSFTGHEIPVNGLLFWILTIFSSSTILAFGYVELYISVQPVIPIRLLADRTVLASSLVNWFMAMSVYTYLYYLPVFWSTVLRLTSTQIALRTISNFVGVSFGSFLAGVYMKHTGKYLVFSIIVNFILVIGIYSLYASSRDTSTVWQYLQLFAPGACYAAALTVTLLALIAAVPFEHQAATTSIQYAFRATGSTIGVAISSFIFQYSLLKELVTNLFSIPNSGYTKEQIEEIISKAFNSSQYTWKAPEIFRNGIIDSYDVGSHSALLFSVITITIGFLISLFIKEHHLHTNFSRK